MVAGIPARFYARAAALPRQASPESCIQPLRRYPMTRSIATLAVLAALSFPAQSQQYPTKPMKAIVNVAPGGVADVTARVLGARLTETMGQPMLIENRPGGDGYIGFEAVTRSDPDGYTLLYAPGSTTMMTPHLIS